MAQPRQRIIDDSGDPQAEYQRRMLVIILVLVFPVVAAAALVLVAVVAGLQRVRAVYVWVGAILAAASVLYFLGIGDYLLFTRDWVIFGRRIPEVGAAALPTATGNFVASHAAAWVMAQIPMALVAGLVVAALWHSNRRRYRATWRDADPELLPRAKALKIVNRRMALWPDRARSVRTLNDLHVRIGIDHYTGKPFDLPAKALQAHCFIDGPSGTGKTTDIVQLVRGLLEAPAARQLEMPLVFLTFKPDPDITEALETIGEITGKRVHRITHDGVGATGTYNPLHSAATSAEMASLVISVEANSANGGFTEPHYFAYGLSFLNLAARVLDHLIETEAVYVRGSKRVTWKRDLWHLHRIARSTAALMDASQTITDEELRLDIDDFTYQCEKTTGFQSACDGIGGRISKNFETGAKQVFADDAATRIDLSAAITAGEIVIFDLDASSDGIASTTIGNLVARDLTSIFAKIGRTNWHKRPTRHRVMWWRSSVEQYRMCPIIIDEFSALGGTVLLDLLQRARSFGGGVILGTQDTGVLEEAGDGVKITVLTNTNLKIVHQQEMLADEYAGRWGTTKAIKETAQTFDEKDIFGTTSRKSGQGSLREVEMYRVHPNTLKRLRVGEVIIADSAALTQHHVLVRSVRPSLPASRRPTPAIAPPLDVPLRDAPRVTTDTPGQVVFEGRENHAAAPREGTPAPAPEVVCEPETPTPHHHRPQPHPEVSEKRVPIAPSLPDLVPEIEATPTSSVSVQPTKKPRRSPPPVARRPVASHHIQSEVPEPNPSKPPSKAPKPPPVSKRPKPKPEVVPEPKGPPATRIPPPPSRVADLAKAFNDEE